MTLKWTDMVEKLDHLSSNELNNLNTYLISKNKEHQRDISTRLVAYLLNGCQGTVTNKFTDEDNKCTRRLSSVRATYCDLHSKDRSKLSRHRHHKKSHQPVDISQINLNDFIKCRNLAIGSTTYLIDDLGFLYDRKELLIVGKIDNACDKLNVDTINWLGCGS